MYYLLILLMAANVLYASECVEHAWLLPREKVHTYITTLLTDPKAQVNANIPETKVWLLHAAIAADQSGTLVTPLLERAANLGFFKRIDNLSHKCYQNWNALHLCAALNSTTTNAEAIITFCTRLHSPFLLQKLLSAQEYYDEKTKEFKTSITPLDVALKYRNVELYKCYAQHNATGSLKSLFTELPKEKEGDISSTYSKINEILGLLHFPAIYPNHIDDTLVYVREQYSLSEHLPRLHEILLAFRQKITAEMAQKSSPAAVTPGESCAATAPLLSKGSEHINS